MSEETQQKSANNRWWESYLVRYFIGFVIGFVCISIMALDIYTSICKQESHRLIDPIIKIEHQEKAITAPEKATSQLNKGGAAEIAILIAVSMLGVTYCYIASTPITILHAARFNRPWISDQARYFWFAWITLAFLHVTKFNVSYHIAVQLASIMAILVLRTLHDYSVAHGKKCKYHESASYFSWLFILAMATYLFGGFIGVSPDNRFESLLLIFSLPAIWIGTTQYLVIFCLMSKDGGEKLKGNYIKLFHARAKKNSRDIRETYTHLREHANSVFIAVVEVSLLCAHALSIRALNIGSGSSCSVSEDSLSRYITLLAFSILFWMTPTIMVWGRANYIEKEFMDNPDSFLPDCNNSCPKVSAGGLVPREPDKAASE